MKLYNTAFWAAILILILAGGGCRDQSLNSALMAVDDAIFPVKSETLVLEHGGLNRTVLVKYPEVYADQRLLPVVIDLHAQGSDAEEEAASSGVALAASKRGFVAVFPQGATPWEQGGFTWNHASAPDANHSDDVGFMAALIEVLAREHRADPRRIFVTGLGQGGNMAFRLGCELSHRIAGIAPVCGEITRESCRPAKDLAVMVFHGGHDQVDSAKAEADLNTWVKRNRCNQPPALKRSDPIIRLFYHGQTAEGDVVSYTIATSGLAWPGGQNTSASPDEPYHELPAAWTILEFFASRPAP